MVPLDEARLKLIGTTVLSPHDEPVLIQDVKEYRDDLFAFGLFLDDDGYSHHHFFRLADDDEDPHRIRCYPVVYLEEMEPLLRLF